MNRFDPADHANTFKPFHHVYGLHDEGFITNGPGSEEWGTKGEGIRYPHHRGLFFAYNKTPYGDFWHGNNGVSQRHKEYKKDREFAGAVVVRETSVNEWTTKDDKPVVRDTREVTAWRISDKQIVLDFDVTLESLTGEAIPLERRLRSTRASTSAPPIPSARTRPPRSRRRAAPRAATPSTPAPPPPSARATTSGPTARGSMQLSRSTETPTA